MNVIKKTTTLTLFAILMLFAISAWADTVMEQKETVYVDGQEKANMKTVMTYGEGYMRSDTPKMNASMIMNFKADKVYMIQHANKGYIEAPISMLMGMADSKEKSAPKAAATPAFKKTGKKEKINGFACEQLLVTSSDGASMEVWVTKAINNKKITEVYKKLMKFGATQNPQASERSKSMEEVLNSGFPIRTVETRGNQKHIMEVTAVKEKKSNPATALPPKGYSPMSPQQMFQAPGGAAPVAP